MGLVSFPILGLDVGARRVGIAVVLSDEVEPQPLKTAVRGNGKAEREIIELVEKLAVKTVVVGLPLNEDGTRSNQCEVVERFARRIERRSAVNLVFTDEYGSTFEALERLGPNSREAKKARESGIVDALSAVVILEDFLNASASNE